MTVTFCRADTGRRRRRYSTSRSCSRSYWMPQTNIMPAADPRIVRIPLEALNGVQRIAFGLYLSPNFLQTTGPLPGTIEVMPTGGPIQRPVPLDDPSSPGYVPISYHVFLPQRDQSPREDPRSHLRARAQATTSLAPRRPSPRRSPRRDSPRLRWNSLATASDPRA